MRTYRRRSSLIGQAQQRRHRPDYWLVLLSIILTVIGLIVVYAISPGLSVQKNVSENYYVSKQLIAIGLSVGIFLLVANLPLNWWRRLEKPLIASALLASLAVRLFGVQVNGAYRWIQIGGLSLQAVELIKFTLLIWLAGFLTDRIRRGELADARRTLKVLLIALAIVGLIVAKVQSDLGSTGVIVAIMGTMTFVAGLPFKRIAAISGIVLIGLVLAITTSGYRRQRLSTFLHPANDCQASGYQACQALITVGSGGMFGLGLSRGVQAYGYLPEAANDSIFAIFAEKFGFVGVVVLLALFVALFARLRRIMEKAPDDYSRLLVAGILAWLSTQTVINIGAMIGLLPLKGITLPFISYGGTSLVFVTGAIGLAFQVSRYTSYRVASTNQNVEGNQHDNYSDRRRLRGAYHPSPSSR